MNSPQIVHAALRALAVLTDAAAVAAPGCPCDLQVVADSLFIPTHIHSMQTILTAVSPDPMTQSQINLIASLISRLVRDDSHRLALAKPNGILDALATRLASFTVASGLVIPGAERLGKGDGGIPDPARRSAKLAPILAAIAAIISDSKYRAFVLITSPTILSVFPNIQFTPSPTVRAAWQASGTLGQHNENLSAMDYLLPTVPPHRTSRRPRQKSAESRDKSAPGAPVHDNSTTESNGQPAQEVVGEADGPESPLVPYLIYLSRASSDDLVRLTAVSVLTSLVRAELVAKPFREVALGLLVVPTLVQLIRDHLEQQCQNDSQSSVDVAMRESWEILEHAPVLLAQLIVDNENLQQAAFDCGVAETLSRLIQEAYQPGITTQPRMWSASGAQGDINMDMDEGPASRKLGQAGILPILAHRIKLRESALKAIAAASAKDEYSKGFVSYDAELCIVESLFQFPGKPLPAKERKVDKPLEAVGPGYGENPPSVIIAACHAIRMLSRSVSILRTVLVDYSVWVPMLRFLRHPDIDIQIVATGVMANLVTDVSPMKEVLSSCRCNPEATGAIG